MLGALEVTDVEGKAVMHPVLFWIVVLCFINFFFILGDSLQNYFIVSRWLFGSISNIKIPQLWACVLPPCETSQLKPAGLWGGLSCLLLPDNFTSCNSLTHSFFSSEDKWNLFFFLFTGCYPTRAFWGHVHSSWCNLSPSEYPGKLHWFFLAFCFQHIYWAHLQFVSSAIPVGRISK